MEFELSRPVVIDELPNSGRVIDIRATEDELAAISDRLGIMAIDALNARIAIRPEIGREISAEGEITASFTQSCVITSEPVHQTLTFPLSRRYSEDATGFDDLDDDDDHISDPMEEGPDPIVDGVVDVGEATVEELALQIPPYPRSPGAEFNDIIDDTDGADDDANPFSKLASLKNDLKTNS